MCKMRRALIVVGKAPIAGRTKTRLVPPLTPDDAAALYRAFLLDTLALAQSLHWERVSLIHPRGHGQDLRSITGTVDLVEQPRDGLGHALVYAFERHFDLGYDTVVLIGSDNPTLRKAPVEAAPDGLQRGSDLVVGPTTDGGYYLIGMCQPHLGVFEGIEWSTPRVYAQTLERAAQLDLRVCAVDEWYDVDEPDDLDRLQHDLATSAADVAPRTRTALRAISLSRAARAP